MDDKPPPRISRKGPPLPLELPEPDASTRLVVHEALNPDPQRWFRIMERADNGDTGPMIDMFADARDRDQHLDGVARKRAQSMMGRPVIFRPQDGLEADADAIDNARYVRHVLFFLSRSQSARELGFRSLLTHLMQAPVDSYAVSPLRWSVSRDGDHVPHFLWAHANRFCFDRESLDLSFYRDEYRVHHNAEPLSGHPDAFVAHVPVGGRSDYPWRRGAMRAAVIPSFIKRNGLKFWMTLAERFGMPQPYIKVPDDTDHDGEGPTDNVAVGMNAIANLGRTWGMVINQGFEVDVIPGSNSNIRGELHKDLIAWANTTQSVGLLGQNLTTEVSGGSFAAAESHRFVAADLHLADATELAETVTQQIVEPIIRYNRPGTPVPVCEISTLPKQVFTNEDVRDSVCTADERRRTMGHEAQPDGMGAEYRRPVSVQVPAVIEPPPVDEEPTAPTDDQPAEPELEPGAEVKDPQAALNGAQVLALKDIVLSVASGELPRDTGIALIVAAFPLSEEQASDIMGSVGTTAFVQPDEEEV